MKNKFSVGDSLELMTPQGNINFTLSTWKMRRRSYADSTRRWLYCVAPGPAGFELN
ncbi:U32 family peptidase C-terminal domain-containing protein [Shigella flexneri]